MVKNIIFFAFASLHVACHNCDMTDGSQCDTIEDAQVLLQARTKTNRKEAAAAVVNSLNVAIHVSDKESAQQASSKQSCPLSGKSWFQESVCLCNPIACTWHDPAVAHSRIAMRAYGGCGMDHTKQYAGGHMVSCGPGGTDCSVLLKRWKAELGRPSPHDGNEYTYQYAICCLEATLTNGDTQNCGKAPNCQWLPASQKDSDCHISQ